MSTPRLSPLLIITTCLAASFLVVFWSLVLPEARSWAVSRQKIDALTKVASVEGTPQPHIEPSSSDQARSQTVLALLPATDRQFDLAVEIEALASSSNVSLTALSVTPQVIVGTPTTTAAATAATAAAPSEAGVYKLALSIQVGGSYEDVQTFTKNLTRLDRFITISQVNMSAPANTSGVVGSVASGKVVAAQLTGQAYFMPSATPAGTPATPAPKPSS
jgi:hypothetical protein